MAESKTTIAIIYDFDKTLSISEMQDDYIRSIGKDPLEFWKRAGEFAKNENMDRILAYLYQMIHDSDLGEKAINRDTLRKFGSGISFHKGVPKWFNLMDELAKRCNVEIEYYLISSGLVEIIEGTPIANRFKKIFACEYYYDKYGKPVWLKNVVNYTTKTQFLFRINKGAPDIWDDDTVNRFMEHQERPIPFENMIYIGDGMTDIPCMKLVKHYGGFSIGVYKDNPKIVQQMMYDDRINAYCKADYSKGRELHNIVCRVVEGISIQSPLRKKSYEQFREAEDCILSSDDESSKQVCLDKND